MAYKSVLLLFFLYSGTLVACQDDTREYELRGPRKHSQSRFQPCQAPLNDNAEHFTETSQYLFNFNGTDEIDNWTEQSDTVRTVGMSKATIVISNNTDYRRAVFFGLLNLQSNGAGFAGMRLLDTTFNVSDYSSLQIHCRGQGNFTNFKIVLRHEGLNSNLNNTYEQTFAAPTGEFAAVDLPLSEFKPYFRGQQVANGTALNTSYISSFGLQFYGGVYLNITQSGPATLEIDWIKAV